MPFYRYRVDFGNSRHHWFCQSAEQRLLIIKMMIEGSIGHMGVLAYFPDAGPFKPIFY